MSEPATLQSTMTPQSATVFGPGWLRGAAVVRILFGLLWAVDAIFKWLPGFIGGETLPDELGGAADVDTPVVHQWLTRWNTIGLAHPAAFATFIAVIETLGAVAIIFGVLSNAAFIGTALLSFGIWSGAEGFHLPFHQGMTDLGPSAGYIFASLALFFAAAGSTWSVDVWLRPRLGRLAWLAAPVVVDR
jgi:thiosulfate dehydrogenase (quinone) large subunit